MTMQIDKDKKYDIYERGLVRGFLNTSVNSKAGAVGLAALTDLTFAFPCYPATEALQKNVR